MSKKKNIHDLIGDQSFVNWVMMSNPNDIKKWNTWKEANPDQSELLEDARMMITGFSHKEPQITDNQTNKSWESFTSKLNQDTPKKSTIIPLRRKLLSIAAALVILLVAFVGIQKFNSTPELIVFETFENETKTFQLPDGSSIILNTNTKVAFYNNWLEQDIRILKLEGEAYFEVAKQPKGKIFQVHSNDLTVEVIGTAFNFNGKRKESVVSLMEGKVNLIKPDIGEKILKEGQTAWFNKTTKQFEIQSDKTAYWKAWTLQKWAFGESTPVTEILERIEETYNLKSQVTNEEILKKNASGEVSIESPEVLFEALSYLLGVEMKIEKDKLIISIAD